MEGSEAMKKDLDRFENWAKGSSMKFKENTGFCTGEGEMLDSKHSLEDEPAVSPGSQKGKLHLRMH